MALTSLDGKQSSVIGTKLSRSSQKSSSGIDVNDLRKDLEKSVKEKSKSEILLEYLNGGEHKHLSDSRVRDLLTDYIQKVAKEDQTQLSELFNSTGMGVYLERSTASYRNGGRDRSAVPALVDDIRSFIANPDDRSDTVRTKLIAAFTDDDGYVSLDTDKAKMVADDKKLLGLLQIASKLGLGKELNAASGSIRKSEYSQSGIDENIIEKVVGLDMSKLENTFDKDTGEIKRGDEVLVRSLNISSNDIEKIFGSEYVGNPPISEGPINWYNFVSNIRVMAASGDEAGLGKYITATVVAFTSKMRELRDNPNITTTERNAIDTESQNLVKVFKNGLGGVNKEIREIFQKALSNSEMLSDFAQHGIAGEAQKQIGESTIKVQIKDFDKYATEHNALSNNVGIAALRASENQITVFDHSSTEASQRITQKAVVRKVEDSGTQITFAKARDLYRSSASDIASKIQSRFGDALLDDSSTANADEIKKFKDGTSAKGSLLDITDKVVKAATKNAADKPITVADHATAVNNLADALSTGFNTILNEADFAENFTGPAGVDKADSLVRNMLSKLLPGKEIPEHLLNSPANAQFRNYITGADRTTSLDTIIKRMIGEAQTAKINRRGDLEFSTSTSTEAQTSNLQRILSNFGTESSAKTLLSQAIANPEEADFFSKISINDVDRLIRDNDTLKDKLLNQANGNYAKLEKLEEEAIKAGPLSTLLFADETHFSSESAQKKAKLLGFLALAKDAGVADNEKLLGNVVDSLLSGQLKGLDTRAKEVKKDEYKTRLQAFLRTGTAGLNIGTDGTPEDKSINEAAKLAGASIIRAAVLDESHTLQIDAENAVLSDRVATIVNVFKTDTSSSVASYEKLEDSIGKALEGNLETVEALKTAVLTELGSDSKSKNIFNQMIGEVNDNYIADSKSKLNSMNAIDIFNSMLSLLRALKTKVFSKSPEAQS
jgi:hypothetical protein